MSNNSSNNTNKMVLTKNDVNQTTNPGDTNPANTSDKLNTGGTTNIAKISSTSETSSTNNTHNTSVTANATTTPDTVNAPPTVNTLSTNSTSPTSTGLQANTQTDINSTPNGLTSTIPGINTDSNQSNGNSQNISSSSNSSYQDTGPVWQDDPQNVPKIEAAQKKDPRLSKYKILIIEDNSDVRYQYEFVLKREGFNVITASNGEEGIVKAINERPQLILLDILMPEMDGWAALKVLREYTSTYRPKIVILSNLGSPEDIQKAYELGADMFLIKADTTLLQVAQKVKEILLSEERPNAYIIPLNINATEVKEFLKTAPHEVRNGKCPLDGGPLGLKVVPIKKRDEGTGKVIQEYIDRIVCLKCGKEWV